MTSPVAFPLANRFVDYAKFDLVHVTSGNTLRSGAGFTTSIAPAYWQIEGTVPLPLTRAERQALDVWFAQLGGGQVGTLLHYSEKPFPLAYAATGWTGLTVAGGGGAFAGTGALYSVDDVNTVTVNTLPASFELTAGDHVGFVKSGRYSLHMITADATSGVGGDVQLSVSPPIPSIVTAGADAVFEKPKGEFIIDPASFSHGSRLNRDGVSFAGRSRVN